MSESGVTLPGPLSLLAVRRPIGIAIALGFIPAPFPRRGPGSVFRLDEGSLHQMLEVLCSKVTGLELREDGAGGVDVVATGGALENMENVAWPEL